MTASDAMDLEPNHRVLSIQSHTVSGYCGNKAAVFPLQTLGFEVDILNTVQFSNHTGYPSWTGNRYSAQDVQDLLDGLEKNELMDDYTHLLTGYIGNYAILEKIEHLVQKLKAKHPDLLYVCDTVMGDCGQLYVSSEIVPLYRSIMKWADVVTPNQFEAETLTETDIHGLEDACLVASKLHQLGSPFVVITSLSLPLTDVPPEIQTESSTDQSLYCLTSQVLSNGTLDQHLISFPTYQGYFTGTGDLFSALTVARLQESLDQKTSWIEAIERVICSVNAITKKTWLYQQALAVNTKPSTAKSVRQCELRLIQGRNEIEHPELYLNVMKRMHVSK